MNIVLIINFSGFYKIKNENVFFYNTVNNKNKIEINSINLKQNFYNYNNGTLDKNIILLKESEPDINFFILASHSGNSINSHFKNLNKINKNDNIKIYYDNKIFDYKVVYKVKINKEKQFFYEEKLANTLILITCDKYNNNQQILIKSVKIM